MTLAMTMSMTAMTMGGVVTSIKASLGIARAHTVVDHAQRPPYR